MRSSRSANPIQIYRIQDVCNVPDTDKDKLYPYPTTLTNRFYINGLTGIPPGGSVTITLPLYTQLAAPVVPTSNNQYAEWWQGQNIQIFAKTIGYWGAEGLRKLFQGDSAIQTSRAVRRRWNSVRVTPTSY